MAEVGTTTMEMDRAMGADALGTEALVDEVESRTMNTCSRLIRFVTTPKGC